MNTIYHKNTIILGNTGHSTQEDQIVLAANKDNQLRFNNDGTIYWNDELINKDSPELYMKFHSIICYIHNNLK